VRFRTTADPIRRETVVPSREREVPSTSASLPAYITK
jgi:hypothetical protein